MLEHRRCIDTFLRKHSDWIDLPESRFSLFAGNEQAIVKIRKPVAKALGLLRPERLINLTRTEFTRGRSFEPDIYLGWEIIECKEGLKGACNAALLMKRLPEESQLDKYFVAERRTHAQREAIFTAMADRVSDVLRKSLPLSRYSTAEALDAGDRRLVAWLNNAVLAVAKENLSERWREQHCNRSAFREEMCKRDATGCVKAGHGDYTSTNIYMNGDRVIILDPCVAFPDMYILDGATEWASLITTARELGCREVSSYLAERASVETGASKELLEHYATRIALIRTTIQVIFGGQNKVTEGELRLKVSK